MTVRFRIRTSAGQELSFASHEMFEDFVRSGDLSMDDLVYDGDSGSWSPARTHPLVLEIEYAKEEAAEAAEAATKAAAASPDNAFGLKLAGQPTKDADTPESAGDSGVEPIEKKAVAEEGKATPLPKGEAFGLELTPAGDMLSAEAAKDAFVKRMESERKSEIDFVAPDRSGITGFTMEEAGAPHELNDPPSRTVPPPAPRRRESQPARQPRREEPKKQPPPAQESPQRRPENKGPFRKVVMGVVGVVGVALGVYFGLPFFSTALDRATPDTTDTADTLETVVVTRPTTRPTATPTPPPVRQPVIASTEAAVRERARERFLTSTQNLLRDLPPIPEEWPGGVYLSLPSDYPVVADVWQGYLSTIRGVRSGDERRYATAYEAALDDAAIEGEARVTRLNSALSSFAEGAALRGAHYDRVEALATAAIQSHNALVEAEGLIIFDPTGTSGGRGSVGRGMSGRDADSQLLLDQVLTLLSGALEAGGLGPREGANVRSWVWDGFLGAVAN